MTSDAWKQTRVLRYTDATQKQCIEWDDRGKPLYSYGHIKYIRENRNLDICVADNNAREVVVVSAAGKLRFRYNGPPSNMRGYFSPRGIATDNLGNILTADDNNCWIHITDENGGFLRYIDSGLHLPWGLCVDYRSNIFVAEWLSGRVKKIQYYK